MFSPAPQADTCLRVCVGSGSGHGLRPEQPRTPDVISVFLSIKSLGVSGALRVATGALGLATACAAALAFKTREGAAAAAEDAAPGDALPAEA